MNSILKDNNNINPLISIITVVYNGEKYLEETITSVLNQSYINKEYIIIDGGSTDGTIDIIKKYEDKISYWISEKDDGIYEAMNKGIKRASGYYIGILNSDDWYEKNTLNIIANIHNSNNNYGVIYGLLRYIKNGIEYKIDSQSHNFLEDRMIPHPTCFIKKSIYEQLNYYDLSYKSASDYDFMLRVKNSGSNFIKVNNIFANFRMEGLSSVSKIGAIESLKIQYKYSLISKKSYILKMFFFKIRQYINV